ncbi:MAG TPA: hypothetical protein VNO30_47420 [Kofleriaceae bacterium]|nr:hypothetical protein [Kofleriaceae bacterium]
MIRKDHDGTARELAVLLALSGIGALVPWLSKYWLFQHAAGNVAATHVLQSLARSPDSVFAPHFTAQLGVTPYSLHGWLLRGLAPITGLVDAHRIIVSALAMATPVTVYFALRRLAPERRINAWLYAPLSMTTFVGTGMEGFALCLPPMLAAWALVCGARPGRPSRPRAIELAAAALLLLISTAAHPVGPVLGAIAITLFQGRRLFRPRALAEAAVALLPAVLWLVAAELSARSLRGESPGYTEVVWTSAARALYYFVVAFWAVSRLEVVARVLIFGLLGWGLVRALVHDRARALPFARIALCFLALLLLGPAKIGGATVGHRFALLAVTFAVFCVELPPILRPARVAAVALATALAVAAIQVPLARRADAIFDEVIAIGARIPRGSTVLPISFERPDLVHSYRWHLQPWSYLVLTRDVITPYVPATGAVGQSGYEFRSLAYRRAPSSGYLLAPIPRRAIDDSCALLSLSPAEDCRSVRVLRYRSYTAQAQKYDFALIFKPPAELVSELARELVQVERRGDLWLFRPRAEAARR